MMRFSLRAAALVAVLALAGCGRGKVAITETPEDHDTRLASSGNIDVSQWLSLPRSELAKLADETEGTLEQQREAFRNKPVEEQLLPKLNAPRTVPVFRKAKYSSTRGFSVPGYVKDGQADAAVAIHLAKYGDQEAARKLVGNDASARATIASLASAKNYPVEWSRLVGLTLIATQNRLALGEVEAASDLVHLHTQLSKLLDENAPEALRAALLSAGRRALVLASKALTGANFKKTALAADVEKAVAEWGQSPAPTSALGTPAARAEAQFGQSPNGSALVATDLDRVRDLLALPLPTDAVQSIVAFLDDGLVAEIAVAYRGKLESSYPEPDHLAYHLDESALTGKEEGKSAGITKTSYTVGKERYEISRASGSASLGALVRLKTDRASMARNLREFGPVSFDRGFDANRVAWVPNLSGLVLTIEDKTALKSLGGQPPALAALRRHASEDLLAGVVLTWSAEATPHAAAQLLPSLAHFGPAAIEGVEDAAGKYLALRWLDNRTRAELRLPFEDSKSAVLTIEDTQAATATAQWQKAVQQRDEGERAARLRDGKPDLRLARSPGVVNDFSLANLKLGQPKAEAETLLPNGKLFRLKPVSGGVSLILATPPADRAAYWATQVMLRYENDKVSEIRVRYREGLVATRAGESLKDRLMNGKVGAPEELSSEWTGLWADLPATSPKPALFRWRDDQTQVTYQRDAGGSEVIWRDRAATATSWRFAGVGPKDLSLGDTKENVEAKFNPVSTSSGAIVYRAPGKGPYEMFLVWYKQERVERIVAVHRDRAGTQPEEVTRALLLVWGRDLEWGSVRRQEARRNTVLGSYFWHDDTTRIQTFAQLEDDGARLLTEWRTWPVGGTTATVKR